MKLPDFLLALVQHDLHLLDLECPLLQPLIQSSRDSLGLGFQDFDVAVLSLQLFGHLDDPLLDLLALQHAVVLQLLYLGTQLRHGLILLLDHADVVGDLGLVGLVPDVPLLRLLPNELHFLAKQGLLLLQLQLGDLVLGLLAAHLQLQLLYPFVEVVPKLLVLPPEHADFPLPILQGPSLLLQGHLGQDAVLLRGPVVDLEYLLALGLEHSLQLVDLLLLLHQSVLERLLQ